MISAWRSEDLETAWRVIPTKQAGQFVIRRVVLDFAAEVTKVEQAEARRKHLTG
jgi:hypothetical protein